MSDEWSEIAGKVAKRFEVAAQFGFNAVHNPTGAAAVAEILRTMGRKLDLAVDRQLADAPDDAATDTAEIAQSSGL